MDHSLAPLELSRFLLSTSTSFEPYIPHSHQDTLNSLQLLGTLGEITKQSFQIQSTPQKTTVPPTVHSEKKLQKTPAPLSDQLILEALRKLRNSDSFRKRHSGIYTTIIRPNSV